MTDENLQLTSNEAMTLLRCKVTFEAEAEEGQPKETFGFRQVTEYRNMTRAQFQFYEAVILKAWTEMNRYQSYARLPELCDVEDPCSKD